MPYKVELIICATDHTWYTDFIEISETSDNIGEEAIDTWTENYIAKKQSKKTDLMLAYVGVYSMTDLEEEDIKEFEKGENEDLRKLPEKEEDIRIFGD